MNKGIDIEGIPSEDELRNSPGFPPDSVQKQKKIVIIECVQEIPCNPCEEACKFNAIKIGNPITNLPVVDFEKCIGCGQCIAKCPGLAIFLLDYNYSKENASLSFPYEYYPLPQIGDQVIAVDRYGRDVCLAKVIKIDNKKSNECTAVVTILFPKEHFRTVRSMKRIRGENDDQE